jgi:parallel beta-helix repeat protein
MSQYVGGIIKGESSGESAILIAASDTPAVIKARADKICDGISDQVEINEGLSMADTVVLAPGTYIVDGSIVMGSNKSLIGSGVGSVIKIKDGLNADINVITNADTTNGNDHIVIKDLKLDGNSANNTSGTQNGIYFVKVAPSGTTPGCKIVNCFIENFRNTGIYLESSSNNTISGNTCLENSQDANNTYDDINVTDNCDYNNIQGNTCRAGGLTNKPRYGIRINTSDCDGNMVTNNDIRNDGFGTGSFSDAGTGTVTTAGNRT